MSSRFQIKRKRVSRNYKFDSQKTTTKKKIEKFIQNTFEDNFKKKNLNIHKNLWFRLNSWFILKILFGKTILTILL